jgi:hypothetical protein
MNDYYTYAYLREDLSPYYVGKGRTYRASSTNRCFKPPCIDRIVLLRENMSEKQAFAHEREMIKMWGRKDLGNGMLRNLTDGGEGMSGHKFSDEHKARIGLARKGRKHTEESKAKMSLSNKGRKKSEEHKAKMSLKGKNISDETRAKMSLASKGRIFSNEHKAKISLAQFARWQKHFEGKY